MTTMTSTKHPPMTSTLDLHDALQGACGFDVTDGHMRELQWDL